MTKTTLIVTKALSTAGSAALSWSLYISSNTREQPEHRSIGSVAPYKDSKGPNESFSYAIMAEIMAILEGVNVRFTAATPPHYHYKRRSQWASLDHFLALERLAAHPSPLQVVHCAPEKRS